MNTSPNRLLFSRAIVPFLSIAALFLPSAVQAGDLAPLGGKYAVKIRMEVNGSTFTGSGSATFRKVGGGGRMAFRSSVKGGQGTEFAAKPVLKLRGEKRAELDDLTLGLMKSVEGSGTFRSNGRRMSFEARGSSGLRLSGRAKAPGGGRRGKLVLVVRGNDPALEPPARYATSTRTLVSGGITRSYVLAQQASQPAPLPLIVAFHGDGGNGAEFRSSLRLEDQLRGNAIVAYLDAPGGVFEYYTASGRNREAAVVNQLIADLNAAGLIRPDRVFLTGMSGGATMVNSIGFRLGPGVVRGLGIMSGSLYAINDDLPPQIPGNPTLPPAILIWGQADQVAGTAYATSGINTRDQYLAAYQAAGSALRSAVPSPTVVYAGAPADIWWCAVPGLGHALFEKAPEALWAYFSSRM
jgi:predicted esterase